MNHLDRGTWLNKEEPPDYEQLAKYGIKTVYVDPNSTNAQSVIDDLKGHSFTGIGIYWATSWLPGASPAQAAQAIKAFVRKLIPQAYPLPTQPQGRPVMLDLEAVSKAWQADFIAAYRAALPGRETAYTNEPFKDGTVVPIDALLHQPLSGSPFIHWYPQLYRGDMSPVDPAAVCLEVARWGFPAERIHPFYDAAHLPDGWRDGCTFTQGRLP